MKKMLALPMILVWALTGCGGGSSFSILSTGETFQQLSNVQNTKVDVLWVIDNSGSMQSSQNNLAANFPSFINTFSAKGYDYKMAVTATDSYLSLPAWTSFYNQIPTPSYYEGLPQINKGKFRDGVGTTHSGVFVIQPNTPDLNNVFMTNVKQGVNGHGDERSFQSFKAALDNPLNAGFVRDGGFLAIILVTDEDDFSHDGTAYLNGQYTNPALHTTDSYVSYLNGLTSSSGATRRFSVNTISINDQACLNQLFNGAQRIGTRVGALADATNGKKASLCADFSTELSDLARDIVKLSTQFYLKTKPLVSTIRVVVNGNVVPSAMMPNPADPTGPWIDDPNYDGGWTYDSAANSIIFNGDSYIPPQGATINVSFDPDGLSF